MTEPPCRCDTPQYHDKDCLYKNWVDAGRPEPDDEKEPDDPVFSKDALYGFYKLPIDLIFPGQQARAPNNNTVKKIRRDITLHGLKTPIVVRPCSDGTYEIKDGNRRLQACKDLGFDEIDCFVVPK